MSDDVEGGTVYAARVGWQAAQAADLNRRRQEALPESARASDPSSLERSIARRRERDQIERARVAFMRDSNG